MKYFLDTEFIEDGRTIDLISIGLVAEDGRELYFVNSECAFSKASPWVLLKVLEPMGIGLNGFVESPQLMSPIIREHYLAMRKRSTIRDAILEFVGKDKPEFWAYYADYDWVVLCQLFGTMMDLPSNFPMSCNDLKQLLNTSGYPEVPTIDDHHALHDARWVKGTFDYLETKWC